MHSLAPDWYARLPRPKRFRQDNSLRCPHCGMVVSYHYRGKDYGVTRSSLEDDVDLKEFDRCPKAPKIS